MIGMSHQNPIRFDHLKPNVPKTKTIPEYFSLGLLADIFRYKIQVLVTAYVPTVTESRDQNA